MLRFVRGAELFSAGILLYFGLSAPFSKPLVLGGLLSEAALAFYVAWRVPHDRHAAVLAVILFVLIDLPFVVWLAGGGLKVPPSPPPAFVASLVFAGVLLITQVAVFFGLLVHLSRPAASA